jgi:hypothetical protein
MVVWRTGTFDGEEQNCLKFVGLMILPAADVFYCMGKLLTYSMEQSPF